MEQATLEQCKNYLECEYEDRRIENKYYRKFKEILDFYETQKLVSVEPEVKSVCENKGYRCRECNRTINEGEASVFGVCDDCWNYAMQTEGRLKKQ